MSLSAFRKIPVSPGITWLEIPAADLRILCGCPVDSVKHLLKLRLIVTTEINGQACQTGPNSILLSDLSIQNGRACNRAEFPVLQMLYLQGQIIPGHPGNTGQRPRILGSANQVQAQMEYLYRGNYGLASKEELVEVGVEPALAADLMRMKLAFAFGRILPMDELVQPVVIGDATTAIGGGAEVRRLRTNVFEFSYQNESIEIDLNLAPGDIYECPYTLDKHVPTRNYFAVIHTGDGDGWDMNRPTMGSIIVFQGRVFLVDVPQHRPCPDLIGYQRQRDRRRLSYSLPRRPPVRPDRADPQRQTLGLLRRADGTCLRIQKTGQRDAGAGSRILQAV